MLLSGRLTPSAAAVACSPLAPRTPHPSHPSPLQEKAALMGKEVTFIGPTSPVMRVLGDETGFNP